MCLRSDLHKEEDVHTTQPLRGKYAQCAKFQFHLFSQSLGFGGNSVVTLKQKQCLAKTQYSIQPKDRNSYLGSNLAPPSHFHLSKNKISEYLISCHPI